MVAARTGEDGGDLSVVAVAPPAPAAVDGLRSCCSGGVNRAKLEPLWPRLVAVVAETDDVMLGSVAFLATPPPPPPPMTLLPLVAVVVPEKIPAALFLGAVVAVVGAAVESCCWGCCFLLRSHRLMRFGHHAPPSMIQLSNSG